MEELCIVKITSLPRNIDYSLFIESMLSSQFLLYCDLKGDATFLITSSKKVLQILSNAIAGIDFQEHRLNLEAQELRYLVPFNVTKTQILDGVYGLLRGCCNNLFISFVPVDKKYVETVKRKVEHRISSKEIRLTRSSGNRVSGTSSSTQSELYYDSDEKMVLLSILDSLNASLLANGTAYKVGIAIDGEKDSALYEYIRSKLLLMEESRIRFQDVHSLLEEFEKKDAVPLDKAYAASLVTFSDRIRRVDIVECRGAKTDGEIALGWDLEGGVREAGEIKVEKSTLNLGSMITGLPGTGKTYVAMHIVDQLIANGTKSVIISPTAEWNEFGASHSMPVISIYKSKVRMNFFKCDSGINIERFYENLASLLSTALGAGPYTRSLEKCLLAAFQKVYKNKRAPDPVEVYSEIENAIVEQHAKRTNVGIDYTKHGENVRAALQNIRLVLMRPEFAYEDGVDFSKLLSSGVVFDLSNVSNNLKPFFYALLLSQIYSISDSFDAAGSRSLRMLICLEEAQLVFHSEEDTAATIDLRQRIQDFRKKGIGLMLITHSITDIDRSIRRLCQTKLYFRQSADVARYACEELIFKEEDRLAIIDRLKALEHRVCALNYVSGEKDEKNIAESTFLKVPEYKITYELQRFPIESFENKDLEEVPMGIKLVDSNHNPKANVRVEVRYVGEKIYDGITDEKGNVRVDRTLKNKKYTLLVLGERKRDTKPFDVIGGKEVELCL